MTPTDTTLPPDLVRENLYNWFGFGNPSGKYWFLGREEYDSLARCRHLDGLRDYYEVRREFDIAEDFVETWEQVYGRPVAEGTSSTTTRHYQAAFLLAFDGTSPRGRNSETGESKTSSFLFTERRFGRRGGNHFSGEVFPLRYHPEKPETFDPYRSVWQTPRTYKEEVLPERIDRLLELLRINPNVEVVVSYAGTDSFVGPVMDRVDHDTVGTRPANKRNEFELHQCYLEGDRSVLMVDAPFFGQGHVGYSELEALAREIPDLLDG